MTDCRIPVNVTQPGPLRFCGRPAGVRITTSPSDLPELLPYCQAHAEAYLGNLVNAVRQDKRPTRVVIEPA